MSDYTKTTNFASKDSLPSGNSGKIVKGTEIDTEFNNIQTAVATKLNVNDSTLTGTTTFGSLSDGTITITAFVDEDNMASDSATLLPTQQSVKAYVDSQVTAQDLDFQADSGGALSIDLDSETLTFTGGTGVDTSGSGNAVTFAIDSTVATLTGTQTLTNKTLTSPVLNTGVSGSAVLDEDNMASDSATHLATQQSIKAYVDSNVTAQDLDVTDGSSTIDIDLDSESLGILGGTGIDSTASGTGVTLAIDSTVTTLEGTQTLTNKTLTSPTLNTPTIGTSFTIGSATITEAELEILDGATVTTDELNVLDGITSTTAELNILDGVTSTTAELNILDGVTATTTELNYVAGVTSAIQTQIDAKAALAGANFTGDVDVAGTLTTDSFSIEDATSPTLTLNDTTSANQKTTLSHTVGASVLTTGDNGVFGSFKVAAFDGTSTINRLLIADNGDVSLYEDGGVTAKVTWDSSEEALEFDDNVKATFGAGSDLQIYHDGSNSYVSDQGTGTLKIQGDSQVRLESTAGERYFVGTNNGAARLYFDDSEKLATTNTGIDVTGTVTADGGTIVSTGSDAFSSKAVGGYAIQAYQDATSSGHTALDLRSDATTDTRYLIRGYNDAAGTPTEVFSVGADGTVTADGLTVDGAGSFTGAFEISGASPKIFLSETDTTDVNTRIRNAAGKLQIQTVDDSDSSPVTRFQIEHSTGDISFYEDTGTTPKMVWDASAESLELTGGGISMNVTAATVPLDIDTNISSAEGSVDVLKAKTINNHYSGIALVREGTTNTGLSFKTTDAGTYDTRMIIDSAGRVGIGLTPSSSDPLTNVAAGILQVNGNMELRFGGTNVDPAGARYFNIVNTDTTLVADQPLGGLQWVGLDSTNPNSNMASITSYSSGNAGTTADLRFKIAGTEAMRIDSSQNLLVGTTDNTIETSSSEEGVNIYPNKISVSRDAGTAANFNRITSDGDIVKFRKNGTVVGSIGSRGGTNLYIAFRTEANGDGCGLTGSAASDGAIIPSDGDGDAVDNHIDLGASGTRFDDIYATNGTIQTSDRNEKQDIAELSDAEQRVAVAAKGLMRKFRWISSVQEKGDEARIHFGIIAQDLQAAFEAEGLDAGRYAMFMSNTWTDEETGEERTRLGVRYSELLAFIISAIQEN